MVRGHNSREQSSLAPMSLGVPMMSFEEDTKEREQGDGTAPGKGEGKKSKWNNDEIAKAQGVLMEMVLWLRVKRVIGDVRTMENRAVNQK